MKTYQSSTENNWIELLPVYLTKEQKDLIRSKNIEDLSDRQALNSTIWTQRIGTVSEEKSDELVAFYNTVKPQLNEGDTYNLISIDLHENGNSYNGILNFRINGEHKQIRF